MPPKSNSSSSAASSSSAIGDIASLIEKVPRDSDGYSVSFQVDDVANWKAFLDHYGYVVVKILSDQEADDTVKEFFSEVQRRQKTLMVPDSDDSSKKNKNDQDDDNDESSASTQQQQPKKYKKLISADDPSSWEDDNWFNTGRFKASFPAVAPQALRNRTHKNIYDFYSQLLGTPRIYSHIDVYGFMRATKDLEWRTSGAGDDQEEVEYVDKPEWRQSLPPHIDKNPWIYTKEVIQEKKFSPFYQGVLALVDCDDTVGGFSIAPCSARHLPSWITTVPKPAAGSQNSTRNHYDFPPNDPWYKTVQHVPIRKGELVVWDSASLHCNYPNSCSDFRLVMYTRCCALDATPRPQVPEDVQADLPSQYRPFTSCDPVDLKTAAAAAGLNKLQMQMLQVIPYEKPTAAKK